MLELDFKQLSYEAKWFDFETAGDPPHPRLKIRPFPSSLGNSTVNDKGIVISGTDRLDRFKYCLVDCENIIDAATGKALKLTDEVKQKLFDFNIAGIPDFVLSRSREWEAEKEEDEKN